MTWYLTYLQLTNAVNTVMTVMVYSYILMHHWASSFFNILKLYLSTKWLPTFGCVQSITVLVLVANSVETLAWNVHYWSPWNQLEIHAWHHPPIFIKQGILWAWLVFPLYSIYCSWIILLRYWEIWCNNRLIPCDDWEICFTF